MISIWSYFEFLPPPHCCWEKLSLELLYIVATVHLMRGYFQLTRTLSTKTSSISWTSPNNLQAPTDRLSPSRLWRHFNHSNQIGILLTDFVKQSIIWRIVFDARAFCVVLYAPWCSIRWVAIKLSFNGNAISGIYSVTSCQINYCLHRFKGGSRLCRIIIFLVHF